MSAWERRVAGDACTREGTIDKGSPSSIRMEYSRTLHAGTRGGLGEDYKGVPPAAAAISGLGTRLAGCLGKTLPRRGRRGKKNVSPSILRTELLDARGFSMRVRMETWEKTAGGS